LWCIVDLVEAVLRAKMAFWRISYLLVGLSAILAGDPPECRDGGPPSYDLHPAEHRP